MFVYLLPCICECNPGIISLTGVVSFMLRTCFYQHMTSSKHVWQVCCKNMFSSLPGRQKVGPDVECLIGQLEEAPDAVSGRAAGVSVARDDAVLMENLERDNVRLAVFLVQDRGPHQPQVCYKKDQTSKIVRIKLSKGSHSLSDVNTK